MIISNQNCFNKVYSSRVYPLTCHWVSFSDVFIYKAFFSNTLQIKLNYSTCDGS